MSSMNDIRTSFAELNAELMKMAWGSAMRSKLHKLGKAINDFSVAHSLALTRDEVDLCRQWFSSVQDTNPDYLEDIDGKLAMAMYVAMGMRIPMSVSLLAQQPHKGALFREKRLDDKRVDGKLPALAAPYGKDDIKALIREVLREIADAR